ncbi:hypothetical protein BDR03DRAFT_1051385, partial [Suillus americanus]
YTIEGLTRNLNNWEDRGWTGVTNSNLFRATAYHLRKRSATTTFRWIKGHNGNKGNEEADRLAGIGARKDTFDEIDTSIPPHFDLRGAKLTGMTQVLAYKNILSFMTDELKNSTRGLLYRTRYAIQNISRHLETDQTLWLGRRNTDLSKKFQIFIYRALHNSLKIGDFWSNIPHLEHRSRCPTCRDATESLEHILTECDSPPQKLIWRLAKQIWPHNDTPWPDTSLGTILGCGSIKTPEETCQGNRGRTKPTNSMQGKSRLLRIIISEPAYLIWVLRCERVIQGTSHNNENIIKRWHRAIDARLQLDRVSASKIKRTEKFTNLVHATWSTTLSKDSPLPKNWVTSLKVLVGIKLPRPPQTEAT